MAVQQPIFVVALPGAGSAVLFELLARARETVRLDDRHAAKVRNVVTDSGCAAETAAEQLRRIYREAGRGTRRVVVSTLARHGLSIAAAHAIWPQARFVYLYRDAQTHIATAAHGAPVTVAAWEAATRATMQDLAALPAASWCAVDYADLLCDPDSEAHWLGQMLNLTWTSERLTGGVALRRHRAAAALQARGIPTVVKLPAELLELAQRAEALQQRHHAAWVLGDAAKARRRASSRASVQRFHRAVVSGRVAAGVCLATVLPQVARAATYQVINLSDSGTGSLRAAVSSANGNAGPDTITFSTAACGAVVLTSGNLKITDSVTVQGPGSDVLAIDGNHVSGIFYPYSKTNLIDVVISGLTIQNGNNRLNGGAITSINANLSVEDSILQNNTTTGGNGGAISVGDSNGQVAPFGNPNIGVTNCIIRGNHAAGGVGGGIALVSQGNVTLTVTGSTLTNNIGNGGGAIAASFAAETVYVENSVVLDNNSVGNGGALLANGKLLSVQNCNVSGNVATTSGGALYMTAAATSAAIVDSSTLSSNRAASTGGAIAVVSGPSLAITASTLSGNAATGRGGGVYARYSGRGVTITNSTLAGNTANAGGGAALYRASGVKIESSTITGNSASGQGGGLYLYGITQATIHNSILAGNTSAASNHNQLGGRSNPTASILFSLVSDANDVVANGNVTIAANTNNILGQDPNLGTLANHGGLTATRLPAPTSPVVDAGDSNQTNLPSHDQRGFMRLVGTAADMGAVELQHCSTLIEGQPGCSENPNTPVQGSTLDSNFVGCATTGGTSSTTGSTTGTTSGTTTSGTTSGTTTGGTTSGTTTSGTTTGGTTSGTTTSGTTTGGTTSGTTTGGTTTGGSTSGTTTGGTTTGGATTGGGGGKSGCAAAPQTNNAFSGFGLLGAVSALLWRRRRRA